MVRVMLNLGLRSFEVCQIRVRHIDLDRGRLMVKNGKGGKDRIVGIPDDDLSLLRQFVSEKDLCPDALLFTTGTGKQIDTRFLRTMVLGIGQRAILNRRLKPHLLRHTMASRLYAATKDLDLVKRALGHCSITTTQIYVHQNPDNVIQAMKNLDLNVIR